MGVFTLTSRPLKRNEQRRQVRYLPLIIFDRKLRWLFFLLLHIQNRLLLVISK
jgi:hypothetical protein